MNKLIQGETLDAMDKLISGGVQVDAIITDPPYGTTACKWDSVIPFDKMWLRLNKLIKPRGAVVLFGSEPFSSALRMSNIKKYKYDWVWDKKLGGNPLNAKIMPLKTTESISIFGKGRITYNPIMRRGVLRKKGGSKTQPAHTGAFNTEYSVVNDTYYPSTIIEYSNANRTGRVHPTQKPVPLMEYLVKTYTNPGDTVLDFTMGSGSTGVACVNTGRDFIGIELDETYFSIAEDRMFDADLALLKAPPSE